MSFGLINVEDTFNHILFLDKFGVQFLSAVLEELSLLDCCSSILEKRSSPHQIVSKKLNPKAKTGTKLFDTFADTLLEMEQVIFEDIITHNVFKFSFQKLYSFLT